MAFSDLVATSRRLQTTKNTKGTKITKKILFFLLATPLHPAD
jgi:hypothetical protein